VRIMRRWADEFDRLHGQYQRHRTGISKCVDRLDEPRPTGLRFLGELKSSRGSVALCGPTLEDTRWSTLWYFCRAVR
jgi:hypothetical protein